MDRWKEGVDKRTHRGIGIEPGRDAKGLTDRQVDGQTSTLKYFVSTVDWFFFLAVTPLIN